MDRSLKDAAAGIRLLALDVDGVLTDGGMYYSERGEELKKFNTRDGHGIGMVTAAGIRVAFVTGEDSKTAAARADKLGITDVYLGVGDKAEAMRDLKRRYSLARDECCYVGDDTGDLPALAEVGLPVAVADALPAVKDAALFVTDRRGGEGAVREVCDMLLRTRGAVPGA